jgi:hypothetical protein
MDPYVFHWEAERAPIRKYPDSIFRGNAAGSVIQHLPSKCKPLSSNSPGKRKEESRGGVRRG